MMSMANLIISRGISTSSARYGKRNFKKFDLINKRGTKIFKKMQFENPDSRYPIDSKSKLFVKNILKFCIFQDDRNFVNRLK